MSTIAQRILAARKKTGKTQKEIAAQLGITYQAYAQYERGTRNPKYSTIEKLAKALNCDISELLTPHEESKMIIDSVIEMLNNGKLEPKQDTELCEDELFDAALEEQEAPGAIVQRYTDFVTTHSYIMQMIQNIGIELRVINWRKISIKYGDDETDAYITELINDISGIESSFEYSIKCMFRDYYGIQFPEPDADENDEDDDGDFEDDDS